MITVTSQQGWLSLSLQSLTNAATRLFDFIIAAKVRIVLLVREKHTAVQVDQRTADVLLLLVSEVVEVQVEDLELWLAREDSK